ncbi:hypothetical protein OAF72_00990 [Akkermansiaceae bacterium]|nr:hypothetical protein [Akkermansiaceae bacterium]
MKFLKILAGFFVAHLLTGTARCSDWGHCSAASPIVVGEHLDMARMKEPTCIGRAN